MPFIALFLLALLPQAAAQSPSSSATVLAAGHAYRLFCSEQGELIRESETGVCEKSETGGVEHFEVRNEDGDAQFSQAAPEGKPFSYVAIFSLANAGRQIIDIDTSLDDHPGGGPKSAHVIYYFEPTANGLVAFRPPLTGVDGFAQLDTGVALSRTFDAGFFQFAVLVGFNGLTHRIEIPPDQTVFSAFPPPERLKPGLSSSSGELKLYGTHDSSAVKTDIKILPGNLVTWWQSLDPVERPPAGQVVQVLAAWAPASLKPADNAAEGVQMIYYDWNNLWLQIQVDNHTGWIKGTANFRMIGLGMTKTNH